MGFFKNALAFGGGDGMICKAESSTCNIEDDTCEVAGVTRSVAAFTCKCEELFRTTKFDQKEHFSTKFGFIWNNSK